MARTPDNREPFNAEMAEGAQRLVEDHIVARIFEKLRQGAINEMVSSKAGGEGDLPRRKAHLKLTVLDEISSELKSIADELKLARIAPEGR